ncbi:MAG: hypothetical protein CL609_19700 [Anaerolineaceae bacterium]|nr:hypothetical protein [Anaerolineaceae bacterium]
MVYVISLCLFFIIFPTSIAVIKNIFFLLTGPKENNVYHIVSFKSKKKKIIIELLIEILILVILFIIFLWSLLNSFIGF